MTSATIFNQSISFNDEKYTSESFDHLLRAFGLGSLIIDAVSVERSHAPSTYLTLKGDTTLPLHEGKVEIEINLDYINGQWSFDFKTTLAVMKLSTLSELGILPSTPFVQPLLDAEYTTVDLIFDSTNSRLYFVCLQSKHNCAIFPGISLGNLGFEFFRCYGAQPELLLDMYATLEAGNTSIEVKIEIPLGGTLAPKSWALSSRSTIPLGAWASDLGALLAQVIKVPVAQLFPADFSAIRTVFLDDLSILLDPVEKKLLFLSIRLKSGKQFEIFDSLAINKVGMRVNVTPSPGQKPAIGLTMFGHMQIKDDAALDLQVILPENLLDPWSLFASGHVDITELKDIENLHWGYEVKDLHLHQGFFTFESVDLKKFEVDFNPVNKTVGAIAFDLQLKAACELIHGLNIINPRLEFIANNPFDVAAAKNPKSLEGSISGTLAVSDIPFTVEATKQINGWSFACAASKPIEIGKLAIALSNHYRSPIALPDVIEEKLQIKLLSLRFTTTTEQNNSPAPGTNNKSQAVQFNAGIDFPLSSEDDAKMALLSFDAFVSQKAENTYEYQFGGELRIGKIGFHVKYDTAKQGDAGTSFFVGAYSDTKNQKLKLSALLGEISPTLAGLVPDALSIIIKDALFAYSKPATDPGKSLFGVDLGIKLDFSQLPLVGKYVASAAGKNIGFDNLQVVFATAEFKANEVQKLNSLLGTFNPPVHNLPAVAQTTTPGMANSPDLNAVVLQRGVNLAAVLNLGPVSQPVMFPVAAQALPTGTTPIAPPPDSAIWLNIQRAVGPLHVERVGVEYRQSKIWVLLSASMSATGLTISLDGLAFGVDPSKLEVDVSLRGMGIDYNNGFVEIGGSFLRLPSTKEDAPIAFGGAAVIKAKGFTISALGSYTTIKDEKDSSKEDSSFFIYGLLDYPIGGPPFFFITGLAAGFGYNRNVVVPPIERLAQFPLIEAAQKKTDASKMLAILQRASAAIPATVGQHFLAAGVMFSSFKMVESTVLLTAAFGKKLELHLLGLSTMRIPSAEFGDAIPAVAEVELALKGSFIPDDGFVELRAQLTPTSYLFSRDCHLSGGFAFMCWLKDGGSAKSGDFILTLGGYHPRFQVLKHYPVVPRLGFLWQMQEFGLSLQGDVYFALTPSAIMAGGHLQVIWKSSAVMAWLKAGIDFLIAWMPYHYDAQAYVDIGIQLTFEFFGTQRLSLEVGADLHIWGPEFAGDATVHLWIISFTIHFGNTAASQAKAIGWEDFKKMFLPEEVCSIAVADGLIHKGDDKDELGIINGKHFRLVTNSVIPATSHQVPNFDAQTAPAIAHHFGVAPMGLPSVTSSKQTIKLSKKIKTNDVSSTAQTDQFFCTAITKNVPSSLWGASLTPQLHGPQFVENALCGFEIKANEPKPAYKTEAVKRQDLLVNDKGAENTRTCTWGAMGKSFTCSTNSIEATTKANTGKRNELLKNLGLSIAELDNDFSFDYLEELPQAEATS
ncbi:DUF6603 domain-containing protein [Undibacterium sp. TS12]|uniref:DUF6603 domain-containing protein n=1 Tax=Undibacterium sp. TS12 TaxID=2908202 RepID=UPI001F4CDF6D|nr:DUF6603 domain-containing protein [Undibacterium sp. TS12]MCH8619358.1 hypothetical protein [Undibacterium sp. TS12]